MKKLISLLFLPAISFAGVHVQQGDPLLTIGQVNATFGVTASTGEWGSSSATTGPNGANAFHGAYMSVRSSGTSQGLLIDSRGVPGNGPQVQVGALTVRNDAASGGPASTLLVLVDSTTDAQTGTGLLEIWANSTTHNDPLIWIHRNSSNSSPEMRWDSPSPNMEMVNTSTATSIGRGKWEPFASPAASEILQVNSRAADNTTFENVAYWEPLSIQPSVGLPGMYVRAQDLTNDSSVLTSSRTACINFFTLNNHTVGICGPANTSNSWGFALPSTFSNAGQVLYQVTNSTPWNWEFTTGGVAGNSLNFTGSAPTWGTPQLTSQTVAQLQAVTPTAVGQMYYCSNCSAIRICVSTGTTVGAFADPIAATTPCN